MSAQKRERSVNFSREEVELLTSLVTEYKNILENKKSDAVIWQKKEQCWMNIEMRFNSKSGVYYRSSKTLKAKYEGLKRATRKKSAEIYRTGGGPSAAPPVEEKVKDKILLSIEGIESEFDSDHVDSTQPMPPSQGSLVIIDSTNIDDDSNAEIIMVYDDNQSNEAAVEPSKHQSFDNQPAQNDDVQSPKTNISEYQVTPKKTGFDNTNDVKRKWTNWKPKSLHYKKHPALSATKTKRPIERFAESRLELAELQKTILEEELLNKKKKWAFEEDEREHKRQIWELERKYWINKL